MVTPLRVSGTFALVTLFFTLLIVVAISPSSATLTPSTSTSTSAAYSGIGDRLLRTFLLFVQQPLTLRQAQNDGWIKYTGCDPDLGIAYSQGDNSGPTPSYSPIVYFTAAGQIAGIGERVWGQPPDALIPDFWRPVSGQSQTYDIAISFRNSSMMCSGASDSVHLLGDQLKINQWFDIPLTAPEAEQAGWVMGNCIGKMGMHHAYDLNAPGNQTWNVSSLVPVLPMYNSHTLAVSAVLFWMPDIQRLEPLGDWEGPFIPSLFCLNWCSSSQCTYDVNFFTTMHWMFTDPSLNDCAKAPCKL